MSTMITVLADTPRFHRKFVEEMIRIEESFDVEFRHVVLNTTGETEEESSILDKARSQGAYSIVLAEQKLWRLLSEPVHDPQFIPLDRAGPLADAERIEAEPVPADGLGHELPKHVSDRLTAEADVVFRRGFGILKGDVLTGPTYGVISNHGGDLTKYRGKPSGFWEFLHDESEIKLTMQRLTDELDGGYVCATDIIDTGDLYTYQETRAIMDERAYRLWSSALNNLLSPDYTPERPEKLGPLYTTPSFVDSLRYIVRNTRGRIRRYRSGDSRPSDPGP